MRIHFVLSLGKGGNWDQIEVMLWQHLTQTWLVSWTKNPFLFAFQHLGIDCFNDFKQTVHSCWKSIALAFLIKDSPSLSGLVQTKVGQTSLGSKPCPSVWLLSDNNCSSHLQYASFYFPFSFSVASTVKLGWSTTNETLNPPKCFNHSLDDLLQLDLIFIWDNAVMRPQYIHLIPVVVKGC